MSRRLALLPIVAVLLAPGAAGADEAVCTKRLGKAIAAYVKARQRAISRCEDRRSNGALPDTTTCRPQCSSGSDEPGTPCLTDADCPSGTCEGTSDANTATKLGRAANKANRRITSACGALPGLPALGPACDSASDATALAQCVTAARQDADVEAINVDTLMNTIYDTAAPVDASLVDCQVAISKAVQRYLKDRIKALIRCQTEVASGRTEGPCPDAATASALAETRVRLDGAIRAGCTEAQLAADAPPSLEFGHPCEQYKVVTFERDGNTNNNLIPVTDRLIGCLADSTAGVADRMVDIAYPAPEGSAFAFGVAAGDATDTAVIFWTRLPDPNSGGFLDVALDDAFISGLQTVPVSSPPGTDGTAKAEVSLLTPSTTYFYRFRQGSDTSTTGRVRTTPAPGDTETVRVGWTGDANAFFRPFTVLEPIRLLDPDAWFFVGDTIYGDDTRSDGVDATTSAEYFGKYRENLEDASLRHLMQAAGTYVMWDDHEVRNDFSGTVPVFATRMATGNQAFRRYFPIREDGGDPMQLYRSFRWGTLAEFFLIDIRQYRSAKYTCCNNALESGFVLTDVDDTCTTSGVLALPNAACNTALQTPGRTVLGATQLAWLENALLNSTATFKFIMNGPPITNLFFQPYDFWIGYPQERDALLSFITTNSIPNVIFLSTDLHGIVISPERVSIGSSQPVPEVVAGAVGMDPIFRELPPSVAGLLPSLPGILTQIGLFDIDRFNAVLLTVAPGAPPTATLDFYDRSGALIHSISFSAS